MHVFFEKNIKPASILIDSC